MQQRPETPTERAALVVATLYDGRSITTAEAAELTGLSKRGAHYMMSRLCRVLTIRLHDGQWMICEVE